MHVHAAVAMARTALCQAMFALAFTWALSSSVFSADETPAATAETPVAEAAAEPAAEAKAEATDAKPAAEGHDHAEGEAHGAHAGHGSMGKELGVWTILPFALLLAAIAIFPLVHGHWWEHNTNKGIVVALLSIPLAIYLLVAFGDGAVHELLDKVKEYISFIALLAALYVISGGIYVKGSLAGTPLANTSLLALGAILASVIGTTGASVVFIRPLLRANRSRQARAHIVIFFIFIVSNCGGLLTPLGDPPLFLGFLKGVPFIWTVQNLWMQWLFVNVVLLVIFNIWDQIVLNREEKLLPGSQLEEAEKHEPFSILGMHNILFLLGVVGVIVLSGQNAFDGINKQFLAFLNVKGLQIIGGQELAMIVLAVVAYVTTPNGNRENNKFTFGPILEVAVLFVGIFITMTPALQILNAWGNNLRPDLGEFALKGPGQFFWATGILSSFLDNAPTYLTLASTACGINGVPVEGDAYLMELLSKGPDAVKLLIAISCGAVFMGANTYIGNGPNFMVKAIAEENGVQMPGFFGYMLYSCGILIPIFIAVTFIFFRG